MAEATAALRVVREFLDEVAAKAGAETAESLAVLHGSLAGQGLKPTRYGGLARSADEYVSDVCELAAHDGSLGWLAAMFNAAAYMVAALPDAAEAVWGSDPDALITAGDRGDGRLDDDQRLTGRWESVVGAAYADWLVLPVTVGAAGRVLVPRAAARIEPRDNVGLGAAGVCDVTVAGWPVDGRHVVSTVDKRGAAMAMAGAAAAVVGSADGVWRHHIGQVRARLATSYGGDEVAHAAPAQVARAASDIDAARLQIIESLNRPDSADSWVHLQAIARARGAADRLLGNSRHALDASDPASRLWRDVHAGCRLAPSRDFGQTGEASGATSSPAEDVDPPLSANMPDRTAADRPVTENGR